MFSSEENIHFVNLPDVVIERIFHYLPFDEIARNRIVCTRFDQMGKVCLNKGYFAARRYHADCTKEIKSKLPRRESERREHPLSGRADILSSIETRLSLLGMTYMKYIENGKHCFIPGKILDEFARVLSIVMKSTTIPSSSELLSELRDMSSMAMEHFDEQIVVKNPVMMLSSSSTRYTNKLISSFSSPLSNKFGAPLTSVHDKSSTPISNSWMSSLTHSPYTSTPDTNVVSSTQFQILKSEMKVLQSRVLRYYRETTAQARRLQEQEGLIQEYAQRLTALEKHLNQPLEPSQDETGPSQPIKRKAASQSSTSCAPSKRKRTEKAAPSSHGMSRRSQDTKNER